MAEANHSMKLLINERNPLRCHRHSKQGLLPTLDQNLQVKSHTKMFLFVPF